VKQVLERCPKESGRYGAKPSSMNPKLHGLDSAVTTRKDTPAQRLMTGSHFKPLTWTLGGGDGIRTHGLYIANV
jgi:hypothetical protein